MPRDGSGNYTLPAGNPVVSGGLIDSTWANPTLADIAIQLNNVFTRDGLLGPTGPFKILAGSVGTPALAFSAESTTGIYRPSAGQLAFTVAGIRQGYFGTSGFWVDGTLNVTGAAALASSLSVAGNMTVSGASTFTGISTFSADPAGRVASGTWTPTYTNVSNTATFTLQSAKYIRVGNQVSFTIKFTCALTSASSAGVIYLTLPISSNFTDIANANGVVSGYTALAANPTVGSLVAETAGDRLEVYWNVNSTSVIQIACSGHYTIL